MKIALAGDWHANAQWAVTAIEYCHAEGAEHILHLGDYGYDFTPNFIDVVEFALRQANINLWFVDGNHEDFTWLYAQPILENGRRRISEHVHHLPRGYRWEWNGTRFLAVGGAYSVDRKWRKLGVSWWSEEVITDEQVREICAGGETDFLISHDTPSGYTIPGLNSGVWPPLEILRANEHRAQLRRIVDVAKPHQIWHGHYHVRYDKSVNLGYGRHVRVHGLDLDGSVLKDNIAIITVPERKPLLTPVDVELGHPGDQG